MILLPAIDILGGKAVRLAQGDFGARTEYDADPLQAARRWVDAGARALHVVDLDGARSGSPVNLGQLARIAAAFAVPVQLGGGLRTLESLRAAVDAGAARVVLGTAAHRDPEFLEQALAALGDRVVVSLDERQGRIAATGWTEDTDTALEQAIERLARQGVRRFVYSSIERDGMLAGPDVEAARRVAAGLCGEFVYSGGVSSVADLRALAALHLANMTGVIVGKALYEGRFTVAEGERALATDAAQTARGS